MAQRHAPTIRQRRFGAELRRLRDAAGLSAPEAANLLGTDRTVISNVEAGRFGISEERLRRLASIYECGDEPLIDTLARMSKGRKGCWWEEYRGKIPPGFLDVSELEYDAARIRTAQTAHLPGLFQTEEHARAVFDLIVPPLRRLEVELRVAHRLARQEVVTGKRRVPYLGTIHEAALRMQLGGRKVARAQLPHLLESSEAENVTFLVIPFSAGGFPTIGNSILYAEAENRRLDTVHMDSPTGAVFFDSPTQLANFRARLDRVEATALTEEESRDFIHAIAKEL
ncbi:helix-turn-helix domain-containing protein [Streptomyces sp. AV19]|uniref:helix-turn-helix domain-containing protein n=1 Tax=Streptomyces sp. AV19 TaxID=2793068 RepID=UPI0018FED5F0|nr:helix-turn-helix transcriptional regulator [Streptomyces sp. AV19]MBH1933871.1 helix-turn-helix domain-containing protein [Streptomyces sp. AV19]MDG4535641.1 helix-turn-helix domain-containing protein [Streptomyces sp. AV19]